ncbi:hypothetical protein HMPREF0496_1316 [Lentilactobacillus hilgardii ATCC 27305]|nr:hypothetical protein HMPREF0496_1316 [Lentilactobacillus hilgardii ATCC 27305]
MIQSFLYISFEDDPSHFRSIFVFLRSRSRVAVLLYFLGIAIYHLYDKTDDQDDNPFEK